MNKTQFRDWCSSIVTEKKPTKPLLMGVLNITPDSFSDGGLYNQSQQALARAEKMIEQGADIIDIGGESSRPGAGKVSEEEEISRVIPVIQAIRRISDIALSVDTTKPSVMEKAVQAGANLVNDISALSHPHAIAMLAKLKVPVCLMHMQGQPENMQLKPHYKQGVIFEIQSFFAERISACITGGIEQHNLILDPGFGFGKTVEDNLKILQHFSIFTQFERPLLIGVSRKSTIGILLNKPVHERLVGGLTMAIYAILKGAHIVRTHDVAETKEAIDTLHAILNIDLLEGIK
jgi:dihydropteroate synthase